MPIPRTRIARIACIGIALCAQSACRAPGPPRAVVGTTSVRPAAAEAAPEGPHVVVLALTEPRAILSDDSRYSVIAVLEFPGASQHYLVLDSRARPGSAPKLLPAHGWNVGWFVGDVLVLGGPQASPQWHGGCDAGALVYDAQSGATLELGASCTAFGAGLTKVAQVHGDRLRVVDLTAHPTPVEMPVPCGGAVSQMRFVNDRILAVVCDRPSLDPVEYPTALVDVDARRALGVFPFMEVPPRMAFDAGGLHGVSSSSGGDSGFDRFQLHELGSKPSTRTVVAMLSHPEPPFTLTPDGNTLVIGESRHSALLVDFATAKKTWLVASARTRPSPDETERIPSALVPTSDGRVVCAGYDDNWGEAPCAGQPYVDVAARRLREAEPTQDLCLPAKGGATLVSLPGHPHGYLTAANRELAVHRSSSGCPIALSADASMLFAVELTPVPDTSKGTNAVVRVVSVETGALRFSVPLSDAPIEGAALGERGRRLVVTYRNATTPATRVAKWIDLDRGNVVAERTVPSPGAGWDNAIIDVTSGKLVLENDVYDLESAAPIVAPAPLPRLVPGVAPFRTLLERFGLSPDELERMGTTGAPPSSVLAFSNDGGAITLSGTHDHPRGAGPIATLAAFDTRHGIALFPDGRAQWIGDPRPDKPVFCMQEDAIVDFGRCASRFVPAGTLESMATRTRR